MGARLRAHRVRQARARGPAGAPFAPQSRVRLIEKQASALQLPAHAGVHTGALRVVDARAHLRHAHRSDRRRASARHISKAAIDGYGSNLIGKAARLLVLRVIVEFPYYGWPLPLESIVSELVARGVVPVLAHPERNTDVAESPERLRPVVRGGRLRPAHRELARRKRRPGAGPLREQLLDAGLAHLVASDWHGRTVRRSGLRAGALAAGDPELGTWLTETVPRALGRGTPPPPRTDGPRSSRRRRGGAAELPGPADSGRRLTGHDRRRTPTRRASAHLAVRSVSTGAARS